MRPGLKLHQGSPAGRDPREMTQDELREAGHEPMSPLQALRARCLDCCGHQQKEVALCPAVECPSWPFRMGIDPWRKPASEARRKAARGVMTRLNARRNRDGTAPSTTPPDHGTEPFPATGPGVASVWTTARVGQTQDTVIHRANGAAHDRDGEEPHVRTPSPRSDSEPAEHQGNTLVEGA